MTKKPHQLAKNASGPHKRVGEVLCGDDSVYRNMTILQEYPVKKINPDFSSGREKIDWVILELKLAIEVHGQQHYDPATFGGISIDEAGTIFRKQLLRDEDKKTAVLEAGWVYLAINHKDTKNLDFDKLSQMIIEAVDKSMDFEPKPKVKKKPAKKKIKSRLSYKKPKKQEDPIDLYETGMNAALEKIKRMGGNLED